MNNKLIQVAAETLRLSNNEQYNECIRLTTPILTDLNQIDDLLAFIGEKVERTPENSHFIISIVLYLYCPYKLTHTQIRMQNGIRQALCRFMKWNDAPAFNYYSSIAIAYWKNPNFKLRVQNLANEFLQLNVNQLLK